VTHKRARPRLLEVCKPLFREALPPLGQARLHLLAGDSLGIFPEGTVNRDGERLLRGRHGAARLSLAAGVPVVPAGIRRGPSRTLELRIGAPQQPPGDGMGLAEVREWHAHIMAGIARLSGKRWSYRSDCHAP